MASVQEFYGRWARLYDVIAGVPGVGRWRARAADALDLSPGDTVVEMGCGTGANLPHLRERVGPEGTVVGIDLTGEMLAVARERIETHGWGNVSAVRADATTAPISGNIDGVLSSFTSGMFDDPGSVIERWCSLLASGGRVCLLDATRSTDRRAVPIDLAFRAFVVASTPPTRKLRYEVPPWKPLEARVRTAHETLRETASEFETERHALGFVRLSAGTVEN